MAVTFYVNGAARQSAAPSDTPLLYVLRNELWLAGTRFGCGANQCGACQVLINGRPLPACDTPLWAVEGKEVITLEGLGTPEKPHPIQSALLAEQAGQCGYCLAGIAINAAALLQQNASPSKSEICAALDQNLCRCGSHNRIVRAVQRAAQSMAGAKS
jgi:nicotinate dehydrogenase subunit A